MTSIEVRDRISCNLNSLNKLFCSSIRDWTYSDANIYIRLLVEYMERLHVKRIAVEANQGFFTYVLLIAAYLAKVVFCCYDPDLPQHRKENIINDYQPDLVVSVYSEQELKPSLSSYNFTRLIYESRNIGVEENDIAYVIYTSGSSGKPKGVLIRYESLENVVSWGINRFELTANDIWAQYAPIWFDMSMFDLFGAVTSGASLVPFSTKDMKLMPGTIIKTKNISFWNSVPQAFSFIKAKKQLNSDCLASLRAIKLGGDCVLKSLVESIFLVLPDVKLFITYGPTEGTIFASCLPLLRTNFETYYENGSVPIGNSIYGIKLCLDKTENNVGEIVLEGQNVASGYLHDASNNSFTVLYDGRESKRIYYTGDYAYIHNDCFYFMGRYDSQVKVSGNRIDLAEIETLLAQKSILSICFVMQNQIVLVYEKTNSYTNYYIEDYVKDNLPQYAIPKMMIPLDKLPINSNGKFDKKRIYEVVQSGTLRSV